jgi:serine phosphatase RsbU (regulator of sigma subunit)
MIAMNKIRELEKALFPESIEFGAAALTLPGQDNSGDKYIVQACRDGVLIGVVDGLGHGNEAAAAAQVAINTLQDHIDESIISLVELCDKELRGSRGVVMCLAALNLLDETLTWIGIGNIEAVLIRSSANTIPLHEHVLLRGGVVGYNLPILQTDVLPISTGDLLIFKTDGINGGAGDDYQENESPRQIADRICSKYAKTTDDALVLVVRYKKALNESN